MFDYQKLRQDLFEKLKDSAPVLDGAERKIELLCRDYEVFCPKQTYCQGLTNYCPAHTAGMRTIDDAGRSKFLI